MIDEYSLEPSSELVDLENVGIQEITVTTYLGQPVIDVIGASMGDILESIGIERVKKYFNIREEEDYYGI